MKNTTILFFDVFDVNDKKFLKYLTALEVFQTA